MGVHLFGPDEAGFVQSSRDFTAPREECPGIMNYPEQPMIEEAEISSSQGEDAAERRPFSSYGGKHMRCDESIR
jgi:hypothetical protein